MGEQAGAQRRGAGPRRPGAPSGAGDPTRGDPRTAPRARVPALCPRLGGRAGGHATRSRRGRPDPRRRRGCVGLGAAGSRRTRRQGARPVARNRRPGAVGGADARALVSSATTGSTDPRRVCGVRVSLGAGSGGERPSPPPALADDATARPEARHPMGPDAPTAASGRAVGAAQGHAPWVRPRRRGPRHLCQPHTGLLQRHGDPAAGAHSASPTAP